jgi:hypothetical protein
MFVQKLRNIEQHIRWERQIFHTRSRYRDISVTSDFVNYALNFFIASVVEKTRTSVTTLCNIIQDHKRKMPKRRLLFSLVLRFMLGAGIFHSVWRRAGPARSRDHSLLHRVQTSPGSHPASYALVTVSYFLGSKAAGTWSWRLTSSYCRGQERWSYSSTPWYVFKAWCLIKHRDKVTFNFTFIVLYY